jgi:hypothetical protein
MNQAYFTFDQELSIFLHPTRRVDRFSYTFNGNPSVKHLIEALRVPHTEVGDIQVNGIPVDLQYLVQTGDYIKVDKAKSLSLVNSEITTSSALEKISSQRRLVSRFILDNHLGKLACYLRMLGFDACYRNDFQDDELAEIASRESRILLTRDRGLLMHRSIEFGYCIRSLFPKEQVVEVLKRYNLFGSIQPFSRCLRCNSSLIPVQKELVLERLEPLTRLFYNDFRICSGCEQIYWKGSHYEHRLEMINEVVQNQDYDE